MFIREFSLVLVCGLGLSGCIAGGSATQDGLPTGVALEQFAPSFPLGIAEQRVSIAAAPATVQSRLNAFGQNCLNGRTVTTGRVAGGGMPVGGQMTQTYFTAITNEDGTSRFIVAQQLGGAVATTQAGLQRNVQLSTKILSDGQGGTILETVANRTFGDIINASTAWANGSSTSCPGIFG